MVLGEGSLSSKASGVGQVAVEAARQAKRQWPQFSHMRMIADIAAIASFHSVLTGKSGQHHHLCAISIQKYKLFNSNINNNVSNNIQ